MLQKFSIFNTIFNDAPQPWQLGFQDSAAPGFTGIVELHNTIFFYLIVICIAVFWVLFSMIIYYNHKKAPAKRYGKLLMWDKLSNSGDTLKLLIPSYI
jgi:cytochrome c oxidase subunit 2